MEKKIYNQKELAQALGVSVKTIQRWHNSGKLKATGTLPNGRRYYTNQQVEKLINPISNNEK